jgi:hypothetical protein
MISYSRLLDAWGVIPEPRRAQGRRFPLPYLLLFSVLAILSGAKSFTHIVIFMRERREILNQVFGSRFKTAPSINTVRLLLHAIGGAPLEATVRGYAEHLVTDGAAHEALPLIALDGKTLRGSFDHINDRKAVHTLSALAVAEKIVLAHFEVDGKTNEIPCVPTLIRQLGLSDVIYTGDAMNCQRERIARGKPSSQPRRPAAMSSLKSKATSRPCFIPLKISRMLAPPPTGAKSRTRFEFIPSCNLTRFCHTDPLTGGMSYGWSTVR